MLGIHHEKGQVWLRRTILRASPRYSVAPPQIHSLIKPSQIAVYPQADITAHSFNQAFSIAVYPHNCRSQIAPLQLRLQTPPP